MIPCDCCHGSGRDECTTCWGDGDVTIEDDEGGIEYAECNDCFGLGSYECVECDGTGEVSDPNDFVDE